MGANAWQRKQNRLAQRNPDRNSPFHFEAAPGTFERWAAETERIEADPESLRY
jgi:hypothetical protein